MLFIVFSRRLSGRSRLNRYPVWRVAGPQMAPNCSWGPPRAVSPGPGHQPPRRARLSRFLCYPLRNGAPRAGHSLGIARGGARNWCPRRQNEESTGQESEAKREEGGRNTGRSSRERTAARARALVAPKRASCSFLLLFPGGSVHINAGHP